MPYNARNPILFFKVSAESPNHQLPKKTEERTLRLTSFEETKNNLTSRLHVDHSTPGFRLVGYMCVFLGGGGPGGLDRVVLVWKG